MKYITTLILALAIQFAHAGNPHKTASALSDPADDPFVVTSFLADSQTNVAMIVDTDAPWSGGLLLSLRNDGANQFAVSHRGEVLVGQNVAGNEADVSIFRRESEGEWHASYSAAFGFGNGKVSYTYQELNDYEATTSLNYNNSSEIFQTAFETGVYWGVFVAGEERTRIWPSADSASTAYVLDTSETHTSGNLLEVGNGGSTALAVTHDGAIKAGSASTWKFLPASGGQLIVEVDGQKYAITATPIP
jgi:hypothetical protein